MDFVKRIIDDWDPIGLLPYAPDDEYHSEIEEVRQLLHLTDAPGELAEGIFKIFAKSFGADVFQKSTADCEHIAQLLLSQKRNRQISRLPHGRDMIYQL